MQRALRCLMVAVAAYAAVSMVAPAIADAALGVGPWSPPVRGPVVRGFDPPATPFGPGHLGIDYAVAPGTPVHAAGDGIVVFAGRVGYGLHVVTRHPGDIRTTDSFLATVAVVAGEAVRRGAVLGTSGGTGPGHGADVLHFGVRVGAVDVDPMLLFAPVDLAAVVHLAAPHGGPAAGDRGTGPPDPSERAALANMLRVDARPALAAPPWWDATEPPPASERSPSERFRGTVSPPALPAARARTSSAVPGEAAGAATLIAGSALVGVSIRLRRRRVAANAEGPDQGRGLRGSLDPGSFG